MVMQSCKDSEHSSNISGTKPAYFIIYNIYVTFTIMDDGNIPNGIIKIDTPYDKFPALYMAQAPLWYLTISSTSEFVENVTLPIELPPRFPKKLEINAYHATETQPEVSYQSLDKDAKILSPIIWTFTTVDNDAITYSTDFFANAPEAVADGKFKFSQECKTVAPNWPFPAVGTQASK